VAAAGAAYDGLVAAGDVASRGTTSASAASFLMT
jgi:hypothetical protein